VDSFKYILALLAVVLMCNTAQAALDHKPLTADQMKCVLDRVNYDLALNPAYLWGGAKLKPGSEKDCSGSLYAYFYG
jgi:hypothetical protein